MIEAQTKQDRSYVDGIGSWWCNIRDGTQSTGGQHDLVIVDQGVLVDASEYVSTADMVTNLECAQG